ncbi:MAG TPA: M67 family metallopeptidase [Dehalococcoidia bacterium]|jgi:proteasome lid subunit RPN8/RPN11|nr:M67 family metallopeptidase [Dehalococcoidia bacterium]
MALELEQRYIDEMIAHAREDAPNECCGIIAGQDGRATKLYRAINAEASPYRYSVHPKDLLRIHNDVDEHGWEFLAIYHSHTHTEAYPSPTDVRLAAGWPDAYYILVSLMDETPAVRAYRIRDGEVTEEPIAVIA